MSFFKKLFNSSENSESSDQPLEDNRLEKYKNIPWMTNRRLENVSICFEAGFVPATSLPTKVERNLRTKDEIAKRLGAIKAIVLWLMVPKEYLPDDEILNFVENNNLELFLTDEEYKILKSPRNDEKLRNLIGWKFENAWPLAWYFGYDAPEITGEMMTGEQMQEIIKNFSCPLDEKIDDWVNSQKTITDEALKQKEDLFYCLHNAVRSAQLGAKTVPPTFDPLGNGGVIHERRHSLTWMLSKGTSWDETDLST